MTLHEELAGAVVQADDCVRATRDPHERVVVHELQIPASTPHDVAAPSHLALDLGE